VNDLIDRWLAMAEPDLSATTVQVTRWFADLYIRPRLGPVPLRKLTAIDLDRFYADLRAEGGRDGGPLAPRTVKRVHNIVRRALQQAVRWGWMTENPAVHASPPRTQRVEPTAPTPDEMSRLLTAATAADPSRRVVRVALERRRPRREQRAHLPQRRARRGWARRQWHKDSSSAPRRDRCSHAARARGTPARWPCPLYAAGFRVERAACDVPERHLSDGALASSSAPPMASSDEALTSAISTGWNYTIAPINYYAVGFGIRTRAARAPLARIDRRFAVALYLYLGDKVVQRSPGLCGSLFLFGASRVMPLRQELARSFSMFSRVFSIAARVSLRDRARRSNGLNPRTDEKSHVSCTLVPPSAGSSS
jgi:Phage integrase, N-terminal SAM-like domain